MGYKARNDEIRDNLTRMRRESEAFLIRMGPGEEQQHDYRCAKECETAHSKMVVLTTLYCHGRFPP